MEGVDEAMDVDRGEMSAESVQALQVGLLLFGNDFAAIKDTLLPGKTMEELVQFYCSSYVYSKAHAHVSGLESAGFQPGSILSGNMRNKVFQRLSTASERPLKMDRVLLASFKAYDACTLPLLDLAEAILRTTDAAAFARAVYQQLPTCGVDLEQLSLTAELCLDWPALEAKMRDSPNLFEAALWPALAAAGWKREPASPATIATAATSASAAGGCRSISRDDVATSPDDAVAGQQQQGPPSLAPSPVPLNPGSAVFVPPLAVTAACKATAAKRLPCGACCTPLAVVELLKASGQPVPADCIQRLRQLELPAAVDECLHLTDAWPHRTAVDPAAKRPATPNSSRKFMCANCAVGSSTVWRAGNAGLTLCNACGMFYNKHDHEHRPEHLVESARVKAAAAAAAATAAADAGVCQAASSPAGGKRGSLPARFTPDSLDCHAGSGDLSDDAAAFCYGRHGSFLAAASGGAGGLSDSGDDEDEAAAGSRRPRTRRRTQANRWLAADDYLLLDGPTRPAESGAGGSGRGTPDSFDGGRTRGGSGSPVRRQRRATRGLGSPSGGSRSMDAEGFGGHKDFQQEGPFYPTVRGASAGGRRSRRHEWQGDEQGGEEERAVASRRTEGLEALLSRVLINSPSDASDASAADALVCMSHASLSRHEQRRLALSLSCDARSGSLSPAPPAASRLALAAAAALAAARRDGQGPAAEGAAGLVPCAGDGGAAASGTDDDEGEAGSREQQQQRCAADGCGEPGGWRFSSIGFDAAAQLAIKFIPSLAAAVGPGGGGEDCGIAQGDGEAADAGDADAMETDGPGVQGTCCCHGVDGFEQAWAAVQAGRREGSCRAGAAIPGWQHPATTAAAAPLQQSPSDPLLLLHEAAAGLDGATHYGQDFNRTYHHQQQQWQQQQQRAEALQPRSLSCPPMRSGSCGSPVSSTAAASGSRNPLPHRSQAQQQPQQHEDLEAALRSTSSSTSMRNKALSRFAAEHQQQQEFSGARPSSPGGSKQRPGGRSPSAGRGGSASPRIARTHTPTGEPIRCANCSCEQTCLWRKDKEHPGRTLCNACGIYKTNNGIDRPTNGLFPTWKNGRERVVRRNMAARPFKPYFTPQQQQHEVAATGLQPAIHPGALLLAAGEQQQQEPNAQTQHAAGLAGSAACVAAARVDAAPAPLVGGSSSALSEVGAVVLGPAAQTARVMSLESEQMNALPGLELGSAGSGDRATLQRISSSAAAATAAAAVAAAASLQGHARGSGGGSSDSGSCIGWAQQLGPQSLGPLADLVGQGWASAVRGGEPVLLPTGHMVLTSGQVVVGRQVNNEMHI